MTTARAARLLMGDHTIESPILTFDEDGLVSVREDLAVEVANVDHDFGEALIVPGFLDVHIHGAAQRDVMEGTSESIDMISAFLAKHGVANYLATTVTASIDDTLRAVDGIARLVERGPQRGGARVLGIHLEGPFVSHVRRGVHPPAHILDPTPELLDRIWEAARGTVLLMTIAPELPGALETIGRASQLGIRVSLGHSDATASQTLAGIEAGAISATHTFNAMRPLDHREPGILGVVLDREDLFAEVICDGVHVSDEMIRLFYKAKGSQRGILITDSMAAAGMPDGQYRLGNLSVQVVDQVARSKGILAGSVLTLDRAVENFTQCTGCSLGQASAMASVTPASMLGLGHPFSVGNAANFNVFAPDGRHMTSFVRGVKI